MYLPKFVRIEFTKHAKERILQRYPELIRYSIIKNIINDSKITKDYGDNRYLFFNERTRMFFVGVVKKKTVILVTVYDDMVYK